MQAHTTSTHFTFHQQYASISQRDHDAAFMWNGINYLLKMSSDLDYLADYLAIKRWVGFPLIRNPFCVPYPLEEGQELLTGEYVWYTIYCG